jgi:hypothetical protein
MAMLEKSVITPLEQPSKAAPVSDKRFNLLPVLLCALAFVACVLLMAAPLSRIHDPVIRLQTPLGGLLTAPGSWLPKDLGFTSNAIASISDTGYVEFLLLIALMFMLYGLCALYLLRQPAQSPTHRPTRLLMCLAALLAGCIFVFTPAMLSHDIFVYAGLSRLLATYHANPYFVPLSKFPSDPFTPLNYYATSVAAYGPLWLLVCGFWGLVLAPLPVVYVLAFRVFALAAHLVNTWLVSKTLREAGQSERVITLGTLLYALNPLVLLESSLGGHNDVFMVTWLLLSIFLCVRAEKQGQLLQPRGYLPAIVAFALAALVKFTALPILILFIAFLVVRTLHASKVRSFDQLRNAQVWKPALLTLIYAGIATGAVLLLFYGPFWVGHSIHSIRDSFSRPPSSLYSQNSVMRSLVEWQQSQPIPRIFAIFTNRKIWDNIDLVTLAALLVFSIIWMWRAPSICTFVLASLATLGILLIVTPWFYSWYITWLIALAAVALPISDSRPGRALLAFSLTFSITSFMTYFFKDGLPPYGNWAPLVSPINIIPTLLVLLITWLIFRPKIRSVQTQARDANQV